MHLLGSSSHTTKYDLTLTLHEVEGSTFGAVVYALALFERETIERYLGYFYKLLEMMVTDETQSIQHMPLMGKAERQRTLYEWNQTEAEYPREKCIHELFEEQVEKTPDGIAFIFKKDQIGYSELNRRANLLAHQLRQAGVQPNTRVGIYLERGLDMIVGLLAVLKAGAAYVPLDPAYPVERLRYIIQDASPAVILTWGSGERLLEETITDLPTFDLSDPALWKWKDEADLPAPATGIRSGDPAYVIYTSGSTGRPKGVTGSHRATVNRLVWMHTKYPFAHGEISCAKASLNFVDSVWELFGPLVQGVPTVLLPAGLNENLSNFVSTLMEFGITRLTLVPSLLRALLEAHSAGHITLPPLRYWICSGEPLPSSLANELLLHINEGRLLNLYGSSEDGGDVTCYEVVAPGSAPLVPIGKPIANSRAYVLDETMQPAPVGIAGQLYVAGAQLSLGYLNQERLTEERFLADPFAEQDAERMFKTGDLARWLPDGTLEFLGRTDEQVKIRGHRVELAEIKYHLERHPGISEAALAVEENGKLEKRVIAYYTPSLPLLENLGPTMLRAYLDSQVPEYMVPSAYVMLDRLPMTPNGKLDRLALPAPRLDAYSVSEYEAPEGGIETKLAQIWSGLLRIDRIGRHDNFFHLGGHSLLATQLASRVRNLFAVEIQIRAIFERPTIFGMALNIEELLGQGISSLSRDPRLTTLLNETIPDLLDKVDDLDEAAIDLLLANALQLKSSRRQSPIPD